MKHTLTYRTFIFLISLAFIFVSCQGPAGTVDAGQYENEIAEWDSERLERLKSPNGWVNLAGLFWLNEGENSVGSGDNNDIVYPRGPESVGTMTLADGQVTFSPRQNIDIKADGEPLDGNIQIFDNNNRSVLITTDSLGFFIIKRGQRYGIRLRDYVHPRLDELQHIDRYPASQEWIVKARFIETDEEMTVRVPDVLGEITEEKVPGILEFEYAGETRRLYPTGSGDRLFIIFADDTNALETYGAGRFLSAGQPDSDGFVYLDFNKAYNPPCAFSPYATCPLPPRENFLTFEVTAGEKAVPY
ncbi:MAG: DUF1684 domain-containing protein [Bacteroidales bacterium]